MDAILWLKDELLHFSEKHQRDEIKLHRHILWFLRSLADTNYGMLRDCAIFHHPRFLQLIRLQTSPRMGYPSRQ